MTGLLAYLACTLALAALACGHQGQHWVPLWVWRTVRAQRGRPRGQTGVSRPQGSSRGSGVTATPLSPSSARTAPSWARTEQDAA